MHEWLSDADARAHNTSRERALPDRGIATEVSDEAIAVDKVAGKSLLIRGVTLIE